MQLNGISIELHPFEQYYEVLWPLMGALTLMASEQTANEDTDSVVFTLDRSQSFILSHHLACTYYTIFLENFRGDSSK